MQPSPEEIARITSALNLHAAPVPADLAFVFGTRLPDPVRLVADLVRQSMARSVVLTGGANGLTGVNEARTHLELLLGLGVPRNLIIVEDTSTNTLENVIVVAKWFHCRRAMMTLKRHMPLGVRYFTCMYAPKASSAPTGTSATKAGRLCSAIGLPFRSTWNAAISRR